jgi:hypothetical protein
MKLVNLKRSAADKTAEKARHKAMGWADPPEPHDYPQGAQINLGEGELSKLGFTEPPKAGAEVTFTGRGKIITVHSEAGGKGKDPTEHVQIQITHLGLEKRVGAAEQMYDRTPAASDNDGDE